MAEYRVRNAEYVAVKVTKEEFIQLIGTRQTAPYVLAVWSEKMQINEVPEELREEVQAIVYNRLAWCGSYADQPVTDQELREFVAALANE